MECRIPELNESRVFKNLVKSSKSEFYQASFFYFIREIKLKEFFKITGGLTKKRPYPLSAEAPVKTATKTPKIFRNSNESLRCGTGFLTKFSFFFGDIGASAEKNMFCSFGYAQICFASVSLISNCEFGNTLHPFYEQFGCCRPQGSVNAYPVAPPQNDQNVCYY